MLTINPGAAKKHLKTCPTLGPYVERMPFPRIEPCDDRFQMLLRSIVFQQLSGKAAGTIWNRFVANYRGNEFPSAARIARTEHEKLRLLGLSNQKATYVLDLADKTARTEIDFAALDGLEDEQIRELLCNVKGIGRWTADMFLMFALHRSDVFPTGDLGIRNSMTRMFALDSHPNPQEMEVLAENWRPHRTIASCYLWRVLDGDNWAWGG